MDREINKKLISETLITWYNHNKRDLPWRDITDPYKIWISEIVLQQTRVNQGINYYLRFIERFPTISELAVATEDEVLKFWQGLGYYSRARNLHKTAKLIVSKHKGVFPTEYNDIIQLSGIGSYTAAAICSFAYNLPYAVVDGNVYRVLSRLFAVDTPIDSSNGHKKFTVLATTLLPIETPGIYNQSIMEFGALQCLPVSPNCDICVLKNTCEAYKLDVVGNLPVKEKKTKVRSRYFNYFYIEYKDKILLNKRGKNDVWENLYEFPLLETNMDCNLKILLEKQECKELFHGIENVTFNISTHSFKHVLSHQVIHATFIETKISSLNEKLNKYLLVSKSEFEKFAVSRLIDKYLELGEKNQ